MSATSLPLIFSSEIFTYGNLRSLNQKVCAFIVHLITITLPISYGLDGPGIESRCGRDFPHPSRPPRRPTQPPLQYVPGLLPGVKRSGRGVGHPPHLAQSLKE